MLLAVVTGQRPRDIPEMKFRDIWDEHLYVSKYLVHYSLQPSFLTSECVEQ